jgi:hypothetical protein
VSNTAVFVAAEIIPQEWSTAGSSH